MDVLAVVLLVRSEAKDVVTDVDGSLNPCKRLTDFFLEYLTGGVDTKKVFCTCIGQGVLQRLLCIGILQLVPIGCSLGWDLIC